MSHRALGGQFRQLAMFHTAEEMMNQHAPMDAMGYRTTDELWKTKLREAANMTPGSGSPGGTLYDSIREHGVQSPVQVLHGVFPSGRPALGDGHHRVAVAHSLDPKMLLPVTHRNSGRHV